jgi:hypothetical protein
VSGQPAWSPGGALMVPDPPRVPARMATSRRYLGPGSRLTAASA